jgi:hypothetical protein
MKKYIIAIAISSAAFISNAQSDKGGEYGSRPKQDPQVQTDKMAQELGLSADQKAKVLVINTETIQKMETISANKGDREAMHAERKKIQEDKEAKLKAILSADQFNKYLAKKEAMKQQHEHRQE